MCVCVCVLARMKEKEDSSYTLAGFLDQETTGGARCKGITTKKEDGEDPTGPKSPATS